MRGRAGGTILKSDIVVPFTVNSFYSGLKAVISGDQLIVPLARIGKSARVDFKSLLCVPVNLVLMLIDLCRSPL